MACGRWATGPTSTHDFFVGKILPGLQSPRGLKASLRRRINSRSAALKMKGMTSAFSTPSPCSSSIEPTTSAHAGPAPASRNAARRRWTAEGEPAQRATIAALDVGGGPGSDTQSGAALDAGIVGGDGNATVVGGGGGAMTAGGASDARLMSET